VTLTAHCLIKNEENFIGYALQSILPFVDRVLVWDTGSTDRTVAIVKNINSPKVEFQEKGPVDEAGHTALRNEMVKETTTEWFMVLDGDEVWPEGELKGIIAEVKSKPSSVNCIFASFIFCVGDVFHFSTWGKYKTSWGLVGHQTPRFFRNIKGISWGGPYDQDTLKYSDESSVLTKENSYISPHYFFHCGVLPRSSKDKEVSLGHGRRFVSTYSLGFLGHGKPLPKGVTVPAVFSSLRPLSTAESLKNLWLDYLPSRL